MAEEPRHAVPVEPVSTRLQDRLQRQRGALARLMRSEALTYGDVDTAFRQVTELAAELLNVERASVWRLDSSGTRLECVDLFSRRLNAHTSGQLVYAQDAPTYFKFIRDARTLAAHDALSDRRTRELKDTYLMPLGIGAMLDAPVLLRGQMVGVVCHEHVGTERRWEFWEELVAGTLADFVSMVSEAAERVRAEQQLGAYRSQLEHVLELRAAEVHRVRSELDRKLGDWEAAGASDPDSSAGYRAILDASPIALILTSLDLTSLDDETVLYANQRAAALFELTGDQMIGRPTRDFYADPEVRAQLRDELERSGRVENVSVQVRTASGRPLWAMVSVQKAMYHGASVAMVGIADVTAQKVAESAILHSAHTLRELFEAAPVPLILSSLEGVIELANQRAADLFEVPIEEVVGLQALEFYVYPEQRAEIIERIKHERVIDGFEVEVYTRNRRRFWALLSARIIEFEGTPALLTGLSDVSRQKVQEVRLRELATKDSLTEAFNRRHFLELCEREVALARRYGTPASICMIDADHFKRINDAYGHAVGDDVLRHLADTCRAALRATDIFARFGGEEFVILLPQTGLVAARAMAERVRELVEKTPVVTSKIPISYTVSIGVAELAEAESVESLLRRSDEAMYAAKQAGRNRVAG